MSFCHNSFFESPFLNDVLLGLGAEAVVHVIQFLLSEREMTNAAGCHRLTNLRSMFVLRCGHVAIFDSSILTEARKSLNLHLISNAWLHMSNHLYPFLRKQFRVRIVPPSLNDVPLGLGAEAVVHVIQF